MSEQLLIDPLVPRGRSKFGVGELCSILGADGEPLSPRTVRDAMINGQLGGNRLPLSAKPGEVERIKVEWVTADDLRLYLLRTRTLAPIEHLGRILDLIDNLPASALDTVMKHTVTVRARKPGR